MCTVIYICIIRTRINAGVSLSSFIYLFKCKRPLVVVTE